MRAFLNPAVRRDEFRGLFADDDYRDVRAFYSSRPQLQPTPLRDLRTVAGALGIRALLAKDETHRFGVNAFKIVGVEYAVHRLGGDAAGRGLVCATAGNHGRAVARVARERRIPCTVFVPAGRTADPLEHATRAARVEAMRSDGARVIDVDGSYEEAVEQAAAFGKTSGAAVVSDTSWDGYEQIPRWIMAGYTHLLDEASRQWTTPPALVVVQAGVGGLVCAAASWFAWRFGTARPFFVVAEPDNAASLLASARNGRAVTIAGPLDTIMAGLRCAEPSPVAWPAIAAGVDAFVTIPDAATIDAIQMMKAAPEGECIDAGPSGACGVAALGAIVRAPEMQQVRSAARLAPSTRAMVIVTEGR